jgi:hypothetical protein
LEKRWQFLCCRFGVPKTGMSQQEKRGNQDSQNAAKS